MAVEAEAELGKDQDNTWGMHLLLAAEKVFRLHMVGLKESDLNSETDKHELADTRKDTPVPHTDMVPVLWGKKPMEEVEYTGIVECKGGRKEVWMFGRGTEVLRVG